jgi:predicted deacylase
VLGVISDPFGIERVELRAPFEGLVLGLTRNPVVHAGDALLHVGATGPPEPAGPG